tara:strand:- start:961 stop:1539 length:579 start_codon:yes stop_codon:yes gene_type:complete
MSTLKVREDKLKDSWDHGQTSEERWLAIHPDAVKTDYKTDRYRHVDFWHGPNETFGVDVKGRKLPDSICLEFKNTVGEKGWMHGDATWIAVEIEEATGFFRFDREEGLDWCRSNISIDYVDSYKQAYKKLYTRSSWGKKDVVTSVTIHDLSELSSFVYIPWDEEDIKKVAAPASFLEYNHPKTGKLMTFMVS